VEELGADAFIYGTLTGIAEDELITAQQIVARIHGGRLPPRRGESVRLLIDPTHVHVFSKVSGDRLSPATESVFTD
jgi:multiple sugar transport system ATP-binding protein